MRRSRECERGSRLAVDSHHELKTPVPDWMAHPMKSALMVWGGWEGHQPRACVELFAPLLRKQGFTVTIADTLDVYTDSALMQAQDLIVPVWTMGTITNAQERGLLDAVARGAG